MITQPLLQGPAVDLETGNWTPQYQALMETLFRNLNISLSEEGFVIPTQSTDNINILGADSTSGTLLFDEAEINGGTAANPNGQLYIRLNDGTFHPVTNT